MRSQYLQVRSAQNSTRNSRFLDLTSTSPAMTMNGMELSAVQQLLKQTSQPRHYEDHILQWKVEPFISTLYAGYPESDNPIDRWRLSWRLKMDFDVDLSELANEIFPLPDEIDVLGVDYLDLFDNEYQEAQVNEHDLWSAASSAVVYTLRARHEPTTPGPVEEMVEDINSKLDGISISMAPVAFEKVDGYRIEFKGPRLFDQLNSIESFFSSSLPDGWIDSRDGLIYLTDFA